MAASLTPWVGKNCRVQVNGTNLKLANWDVTPEIGVISTNNFESAGFDEAAGGFKKCKIRVSGLWDQAQNPALAPPKIYIGSVLTNLYLYLDQTTSFRWEFTSALCITTPTKVEVEGGVQFEFTAQSLGTFNYPGTITP